MKVLLIHPDDTPVSGNWSATRWDWVVDLGKNSAASYQHWEELLGCPVSGLTRDGLDDLRQIREWAGSGHNLMMDREGLDWWELFIPVYATALEGISQLMRLAEVIGKRNADVYITREQGYDVALEQLLERPVQTFNSATKDKLGSWLRRVVRSIGRGGFRSTKQVLLDRWDPTFTVRRVLPAKRSQIMKEVVLLPSAFANVSRVAAAYAQVLPNQQFLLVATRYSAHDVCLPSNVKCHELAAYAKAQFHKQEFQHLLEQWGRISNLLSERKEFRIGLKAGTFSTLPSLLRAGLATRDAWCQVFHRQPIQAVLCGDDSNPFTRMTLMLAQHRNLPAVSFHHGALDFRTAVKTYDKGLYLAKNEMEYDYLVQNCGVDPQTIVLGAPSHPEMASSAPREPGENILFFSESYEAMHGRAKEVYAQVLPELCRIASRYRRKLVVKLHPSESKTERKKLLRKVLNKEQALIEIVSGELKAELLRHAWFGLTFSSSAAVECAQAGVPCFVGLWVDMSGYGYADQYVRFGAALPLHSPSELSDIPARLKRHQISSQAQQQFGTPISAELLGRLLTNAETVSANNEPSDALTSCAG